MTELTADEFEWAWSQSPDVKAIESLEEHNYVYRPWDRRWIYAGILLAPLDPTTLCDCQLKADNTEVLVPLMIKVGLIDDHTGKVFRIAVGQCHMCQTVYWQTNDPAAAQGGLL